MIARHARSKGRAPSTPVSSGAGRSVAADDFGPSCAWLSKHAVVIALLGGACAPEWEEQEIDGLRVLTRSTWALPGGRIPVDLEVLPGETAALVTGVVDSERLGFVKSVSSPVHGDIFEASDLWEDPHNRSNAAFAANVIVMNWPLDAAAEALDAGRWRFDLRVDQEDAPVELAVVLKEDPSTDEGTLGVDVVINEALGADAEMSRGLDAAITRWRDNIYAPAGITLDVAMVPSDIPARLPAPGRGEDAVYEAIAAARALDRVSLVVVERIENGTLVLGVAGGIPGPLTPARNAAVTVSAVEAAGRDRMFSEGEIELFAETMAHEVGHYLGLFHPVELPELGASTATTWDALPDTPECGGFNDECVRVLGENLMFPSPVCDSGGAVSCESFLHQTELSTLQVAIAQRYVGVR